MKYHRVLLMAAVWALLSPSTLEGQGNTAKPSQFISVLKDTPEKPWKIPYHNDTIWVVTADPFLLSASRLYMRITIEGMLLLKPLLRSIQADLGKAHPKGNAPKRATEASKVIKAILSQELTDEDWLESEPEAEELHEEDHLFIRHLRRKAFSWFWTTPPFHSQDLSKATSARWLVFYDMAKVLLGRFTHPGSPGWAIRAGHRRAGRKDALPQQRGAEHLIPFGADHLYFSSKEGLNWVALQAEGKGGILDSSARLNEAARGLIELTFTDRWSKDSAREALWNAIRSMTGETLQDHLDNRENLKSATLPSSCKRDWDLLRTQSLLSSSLVIRKGTMHSLFGGRFGRRRGKPKKLYVLFAINDKTLLWLKESAQRLKRAATLALKLADSKKAKSSWEWHLNRIKLLHDDLNLITRAIASIKPGPLTDILATTSGSKLAKSISTIHFEDWCYRGTTTMADPEWEGSKIPEASWLFHSFKMPRLHQVRFRFILDGKPIDGIGAFPMLSFKSRDGRWEWVFNRLIKKPDSKGQGN